MPPFSSGWEVMAFWGSLIVILGVLVECVDLLAKCSENSRCRKWGKRFVWHSNDRRVITQFLHRIKPYELLIEIVGFILVVGGLGLELYGGTKALLASDEEDRRLQRELAAVNPLTKPIVSLSAIASFRITGDLLPYGEPTPNPDLYKAGINFGVGTNLSSTDISLSAEASDIIVVPVIPRIPPHLNERDILITFHEIPLFERHFFGNWSWDNRVEVFDEVRIFCMHIPEFGSNVNILPGGTVSVTANSLHWTLSIPPQKEKWGLLTGQIVTNANKQVTTEIFPIDVISAIGGEKLGRFDGK